MAAYFKVPSLSEFKSKSNVSKAFRSADQILSSIDKALTTYQGVTDFEQRFISLTDLFFSINSWSIASHKKSKAIEPARRDAIMDLFDIVMTELGKMLDVAPIKWGLPDVREIERKLADVFGLAVGEHGRAADTDYRAKFMDDAERKLSQIHIIKGQLFHFKSDGFRMKLDLLETTDFEDISGAGKVGVEIAPGFAPFVMSMTREFFMTKHYLPAKNKYGFNPGGGVFHSTYLGPNKKVGAAGTLLVRRGKLIGLRGDSGHYKPSAANMANCIRAFASHGVCITDVKLYGFKSLRAVRNASATSQMRNTQDRDGVSVSAADFMDDPNDSGA